MALLRSYRAPTRVDGMGIAGVGAMAVGRVIAFGAPNPHDLPTVCSYAINHRFIHERTMVSGALLSSVLGFLFLYFIHGFSALLSRV